MYVYRSRRGCVTPLQHTHCNTHTATHPAKKILLQQLCNTHCNTHCNKRFRLIKDGRLPWNEGRKRRTVSMNLHGVCRFVRSTSRWAPKAHRMMGKTQWKHCERSCGTNVLVLDKQSRHPFLAVPTSKKDVHKKCRYRTSSELENSVLEINHVTNVTTVLDETAASDRVSRSTHPAKKTASSSRGRAVRRPRAALSVFAHTLTPVNLFWLVLNLILGHVVGVFQWVAYWIVHISV